MKQNYWLWLAIGSGIFVLVIAVAGIVIVSKILTNSFGGFSLPSLVPAISSPAPVSETVPAPASTPLPPAVASDAALLKARTDLKALRQEIESVNLFAPDLALPNLDLALEIKPQE